MQEPMDVEADQENGRVYELAAELFGVLAKRKEGTQVFYRVLSQRAVTLCRTVCTQIAIEMDEPSQVPASERLSPRAAP